MTVAAPPTDTPLPADATADTTADATAAATAEAAASAWANLRAEEDAAIAERRKVAYADEPAQRERPRVGLALSGGGIRSATFCLGLLRGLAQNSLLKRFDYLSTISGGGYVGAAFGRLVGTCGIDRAEAVLRASDSLVLSWLRRNGRYLTPAGARDFGMAIATYLRAGIAVHIELGFLALLLGLLAIAPHVAQTALAVFQATAWQEWPSAWWPLALGGWLLLAPGTMVAYWPLRPRGAPGERTIADDPIGRELAALVVTSAVVLVLAAASGAGGRDIAWIGAPSAHCLVALTFAGIVGRLLALCVRLYAHARDDAYDTRAAQRNRLTRALRRINAGTLALFSIGLFDVVSWHGMLALEQVHAWLAGGIGIGGVIAVLVRSLSEPLQKMATSADGPRSNWLPQIVNVVGIAVALLIACAWMVLLQWLVFDADSWSAFAYLPPAARAAVVFAVVVLWFGLTGRHRETVNASSLHGFYSSRLTRAYLSIGNPLRFGALAQTRAPDRSIDPVASVTDVIPGDDIALADYRPERRGGPLHLIGTCLNQTVDDRSDLYNADRKGAALVVSARGAEVGLGSISGNADLGTLGRWTAISGAAAAPGAGSYTTTGWAFLLFVVGARLGYWLDAVSARAGAATAPAVERGGLARVLAGVSARLRETKPGLLASEALASFGGRTRRWWFLSDGGHFDNTGVYALLRRELDFILLADCGADAKFEFADLENLIRKARIDFDAEIELYSREQAAELFPGATGADLTVLSPDEMADKHSQRGVLLARICYHRSDPARRTFGTLLIVKPNLHDALDNDLLAYARRNPTFPHQSTGDQFFDEAQWESYHRLGEDFGRAVTRVWMNHLPGWRVPIERDIDLAPLRRPALAEAPAAVVPAWRRGAAATALGTTLGIGALGTLLLPAWQAIESVQQDRDAKSARLIAQKNAANTSLENVEGDVDAALKPGAADLSVAGARKLREMYDTNAAFPGDPQLRYVGALIGDVQSACGTRGSACADTPSKTPRLCSAVCDNVVLAKPDAYWSYAPAQDEDWQRNPLVQFVDGILPTLRLERMSDTRVQRVDRPAAAPPAGTEPSAPADMSPPVATAPPVEAPPPAQAPPVFETPPPVVDHGPTATAPALPPPAVGTRTPAADPLAICRDDKGPMLVYVQIYDETMRARLQTFQGEVDKLQRYLSVAGVENVVQTAALRGNKSPKPWRDPTLIVHRPATNDLACANAVAMRLQGTLDTLYPAANARIRVRGLPPSFQSTRHVLELWLPSAQTAASAD